ncbi:MAG: NUDIX domain-containing protein [Clostridia bacterium]|nr:NUDIX domain-containing protein [Clostridia bacterium]
MKHEKSCGAVVYKIENGEYLFLVERMTLGHWSLPKGHVESGESEAETARREIKEETNLDVELDTEFRSVISYSPFRGCVKEVVYFAAKAVAGRLINQECEVAELAWLKYEQARQRLTYASDREVLEQARNYLTGTAQEI